MTEIDVILDDCLRRMRTDGLTVEALLALYPEQAAELRPLLKAAHRVRAAGDVAPRPGFEAQGRARLMRQITASRPAQNRLLLPAWRLAISMAALVLVLLATTTAFAQAALPGEALYSWKLGSEHIWRAVSLNQVDVDLSIAERRTTELQSVAHDPARFLKARDEFHQVLDRLEAEKDPHNSMQIDAALAAHQNNLRNRGISDSKLDELVKDKGPKTK